MTCQWLSRCLLVPALLETSDGAFTFQDVARLRVIHAGCLDAVIDDEIERVDQEHHRSSMRPKTSAKLPSGSGPTRALAQPLQSAPAQRQRTRDQGRMRKRVRELNSSGIAGPVMARLCRQQQPPGTAAIWGLAAVTGDGARWQKMTRSGHR